MTKNLELYIHIPFCVRKCSYCDFLSFPADEKTQEEYARALIREIRYYGPLMRDRVVSTIYIGGGTPSWLDPALMQEILSVIYTQFRVENTAEISMECNPGTVTKESVAAYFAAGINRLSIGLQSADDAELKLLGRIHTFDQFVKTYELARGAGFSNINVDLISGLPYQTAEKFLPTLKTVIRMQPEHISAYSLIIEKGTPFYDQYKFDAVRQEAGLPTEILPTEDEAYRIYKVTQSVLKENGYGQYEISNYAKPGFACRHNIGYWSREDYLGLGLGAASLIDNIRYTNLTDLYSYISLSENIGIKELSYEQEESEGYVADRETKALPPNTAFWEVEKKKVEKKVLGTTLHESGQQLSRKEQMEEFMFLGLRMTAGVSRDAFLACFHTPIEAVYRDVIEELKEEELLRVHAGRVFLTDKGLDLSNYAMAKFLQ